MSASVIKTARRLFEILEHFDEAQRPLTLKDVSTRFSYPVSSASAVLKSMVLLGLLDYDRFSRTYMPTMRIVQLGRWVEGALFGEGEVISLANHINNVTEETVCIATQSDLLTQYVHVVPSPLAIQYAIKPGLIRPLARAALGHVLLSARSDEMIEKILRRFNFEAIPDQRVKLDDLMKSIRKIRSDGYISSPSSVTPGASVIGMLLPERRHGRILAIGVAGPETRLLARQAQILDELRTGVSKLLTVD